MNRKVLTGLLGISLAWGSLAAAPPVKPNPEAVEAVAQVFLGPEPDRSSTLAWSRQALEAGALRAPKERRTANVLLARGLTGVGVQSLLAPRGMDLVSFECKVPLPGPPGHMMTIWLGSRSLWFVRNGSLEDLVDKAIGHQRFQFLQRAQRMADQPAMKEAIAEHRAVATSPEFAVYRLEVLGTRESLLALQRDPLVHAVLVNENEEVVAAFEKERAEMASQVIYRGPSIYMGPIDPDLPLPEMPELPEDAAAAMAFDAAMSAETDEIPEQKSNH